MRTASGGEVFPQTAFLNADSFNLACQIKAAVIENTLSQCKDSNNGN